MRSIVFTNRLKLFAAVSALSIAAIGVFYPRYVGSRVTASASGPSPAHTNAPGERNCTFCHTSFPLNPTPGSLQISGIPKNYKPGQQIPVTVTINQPDGVIFGFQMAGIDGGGRNAGIFTIPSATSTEMQIVQGVVDGNTRNYIEHTVNGIIPTTLGTKSWQFTWTAPPRRIGKIAFYAAGNSADSDGSPNGDRIFTTSSATLAGTAVSNFDGDGKSEIAVFRPSGGLWYSANSTDGNGQIVQWGAQGDVPAPGDYDGDGTTDRVVFRPNNGVWYLLQSSAGVSTFQFGAQGDIPVPGDYDGDLKTDAAVFRPSDGTWWILKSSGGLSAYSWGVSSDLTAQGDYDGDAKTDVAVFRPSDGIWYILQSSDGFKAVQFGLSGDRPVQGDYDGDGRHDIAIFRPSAGQFWIFGSTAGVTATQFGLAEDKAVPADFDGDGRTDIAVYRPSSGSWWAIRSSDSSLLVNQFGLASDVPVPSGYIAPQ